VRTVAVKVRIPDGERCEGCGFLGKVAGYRPEEEYGPAPDVLWECSHYGKQLATTGLFGGAPVKCAECLKDGRKL